MAFRAGWTLALLALAGGLLAGCAERSAPPAIRLVDVVSPEDTPVPDVDALLKSLASPRLALNFGPDSRPQDGILGGRAITRLLGGPDAKPGTARVEPGPQGWQLVLEGPVAFASLATVGTDRRVLCRARCRGIAPPATGAWVLELDEALTDLRQVQRRFATVLPRATALHPLGPPDASGWVRFGRLWELKASTRALAFVLASVGDAVELASAELFAIPDALAPLLEMALPADGLRHVTVRRDRREALLVTVPGEVRVSVRLPDRYPRLICTPTFIGTGRPGSVEIRIAAQDGNRTLEVRRNLAWPDATRAWGEIELDLTPLAGRQVELVLAAAPARSDAGAGGLVAFGVPVVEARREGTRDDVVLISLDTVRADRLSLFGYGRPTTPVLKELAASACVFEQAMASAPWTLPSHATLFSGQLPDRHGVIQRTGQLDAGRVELLAVAFRRAGYQTVAITGGGFLDPAFGFSQGFERYGTQDPASLRGAVVSDDARATLRRLLRAERRRPLFLFVQTYAAHDYASTADDLRAVGAEPHEVRALRRGVDLEAWRRRLRAAGPSDELRRRAGLAYDAALRVADRLVGDIVTELRRGRRLDRTLLVVTADHGEELLERGRLGHGSDIYEEQVHIPLLIRGPGITPARIGTPVTLADLSVTLRELASLPPSPFFQDGRSLLPLLHGGSLPPRPVLLRAGDELHALRDQQTKAVFRYRTGELVSSRLYDLSQDPGEQSDVAGSSRERMQESGRRLEQWLRELRREPPPPTLPAIPERLAEDLRRLGYVGDE